MICALASTAQPAKKTARLNLRNNITSPFGEMTGTFQTPSAGHDNAAFIVSHAAMRIDIISAVPKLLESPLSESIIKRARDKGVVEIVTHDLREHGMGKYHQIDD